MDVVTDMRGLLTIMRARRKAGNARLKTVLPSERVCPSYPWAMLIAH
jgi:hypothetical protein